MAHSEGIIEALPTERRCPFDPPSELTDLITERPIARMHYPDGHVGWLVTNYQLAKEVLSSPRISARHELRRFPVPFPIKLGPAAPGVFVGMDAPEHTRYRRILHPYFSPQTLNALLPSLQAQVIDIIDEIACRSECDPR